MSKDMDMEIRCSFCGKTQDEVTRLVEGPGVYICDSCINFCSSLLFDDENAYKEKKKSKKEPEKVLPKPREIKALLDEYVIGQDEAKKTLSVAVYNHYKRIKQKGFDDVEIEKSNCICIGDTGVGKCISPDTLVTIRNKKTGDIQFISVDDFKNLYCK